MRRACLLLAFALVALVPAGARSASAELLPAPLDEQPCLERVVRAAAPIMVGDVGSCPGVRPGAYIEIPSRNAGCTLGFLYQGVKDLRWYITTAGHCAVAENKEAVWAEGKGPVVTNIDGKPLGRFVFAALKGRYDIGVILVSKGITPKASVCHFGGPTGVTDTRGSSRIYIEHYGNSIGFGDVIPARTGIAHNMQDPYTVFATIPSMLGDSGGPVVAASSGKAIGYVTAIGWDPTTKAGFFGAPVIITRLSPQMSYAQKMLKRSFKLRVAPHSPSML